MSFKPTRSSAAGPLSALLVLALALLSGCGKQGPPQPPLRNVPAPTQDLSVAQRGTRVLLAFTYPKTSPGGRALAGIKGIEVWEAVAPAPALVTAPVVPPATAGATAGTAAPAPPAAPTGTAPAAPAAVAPVLPPLGAVQLKALAKKRLDLKEADIAGVTVGDRVLIDLQIPEPLPKPAEAHYFYVRTLGPDGDPSEPSNQVALVVKAPPAPPEKVEAVPEASGIRVSWVSEPDVLGYAVYRRPSQEKVFGRPVGLIAGATNNAYLDASAQFGQSYIYAVTAVSERSPFLESAIQKEQEVRYVDRFAPPAPTDLVALAEAGKVRLIWKTVEAADLAGYVVFRRLSTAETFEKITPEPLTTPELSDTNVKAGQIYVYRVRAVDNAGNESDPSAAAIANLP